jgi:cytoskeletal protein CcmA (bactofilin family)
MNTKRVTFFLLTIFVLMFAFLVAPVGQAYAMDFRSGDSVSVSKDSVIPGSLAVAGKNLMIDGDIGGDLYCAGQDVVISGTVEGDVICAGQSITVNGVVGGSVRVFGQTVSLQGPVDRNVTVFAQTVSTTENSDVAGEFIAGAQNISMAGVIGNDVVAAAERVSVDGEVDGAMKLDANSLQFGQNANIRGNINYTSDRQALVDNGASLSGELTRQPSREKVTKQAEVFGRPLSSSRSWVGSLLSKILVYIGIGLLLVLLLSRKSEDVAGYIEEHALRSLAVGFLVLVATPMFIILCAVTIIGIPFALIAALLYALVLVIARVYVALAIGKRLLTRFAPDKEDSAVWAIVFGVPVCWVVFAVPLVGWVFSGIAEIIGLGALVVGLMPQKTEVTRRKR